MNKIEWINLISELKIIFCGHKDKIGQDYYKHPIRVACKLPIGISDDAITAALLHDLLEDTTYSINEIAIDKVKIPNETKTLVNLLTKNPNESYSQYIQKLCKINKLPQIYQIELLIIKLCDIWDNLEITRLNKLKPEKYKQLLNKYLPAVDIIIDEINNKFENYKIDPDINYPTLNIIFDSIKRLTNAYKYYEI